jgi:type II secretory pathway pseudopilin PulG
MKTEKAVTRAHEDPRRARRGEEGFTLLETVIAMIVMMTVGLGASALFLYSITNNSAAGARAQALAVAQQEMERLRSVPWDDPLLDVTAVAPAAPAGGGGGAAAPAFAGGGFNASAKPNPTPTPSPTPTTGGGDDAISAGGYKFTVDKTVATVPQFDVTVGGVTRPTVKLITLTVTPTLNNIPWAAAGVTITTTRATLQRGPN